jgi:subtilisin-like proprotein convertase family protein
MTTKLRLLFTITIAFLSFYGTAQTNFWKKESVPLDRQGKFAQRFDVKKGTVFNFKEDLFKNELKDISTRRKNSKIVYFPDENGNPIPFEIYESPVMSPALAAKFPSIKSYAGQGVKDRSEKIRVSVSDAGIQSMMVRANGKGNVYIQKSKKDTYVLYVRDKDSPIDIDFICDTKSLAEKSMGNSALKPVDGQILRKFRLAVSATGEYTTYHGGTVAGAMAAINATITRVNEVFENDLGVTLELVANNDALIFTNAASDPYNGNLNTQVQNTITSIIGEANYDIGHLFQNDQNDGNAGFVGAVCVDNKKGSAYSSSQNPSGDIFDIDFVAHEMGHQFGANHTWSFESEGTQVQVEPGSGTTIMGYAGITGVNNVASQGDDYFHYVSIVQIADYLTTVSCGEVINLTNTPPVVGVIGDYIIPKSTAFFLEGVATDSDAGDVLTYTWEEVDDGVVTQATFGPTNPGGANFRSLKPTTDPRRYFPKLTSVLAGNLTQTLPNINSTWETVSDVERDLNFVFTVRDNAIGGGQVVSEEVNVSVVNSAGPFKVTSQSSNFSLAAGETLDVQWDVANTEKAPIFAAGVDILLSTDGGLTFPFILAQDVPNDGEHVVVVPGNPTVQGRIMVAAHDNVFYAVNAADFTIEASEIVLNFSSLDYDVCQPSDLVIPFDYETYLGFNEEVTFGVPIIPTGLDISFFPATATTDTAVNMTVTGTGNVPEGTYTFYVQAISATRSKTVAMNLHVHDTNFTDVTLLSPANGAMDVSNRLTLEWEADPSYTIYDVQLATNASFTNIVETASVISNTYIPENLGNETTYYWRVRPKNSCGTGTYGPAFRFTTIQFSCKNEAADGLPLEISASGTPTITSKIAFYENLILADLNVNIDLDHSFLADLVISLTSPSGTTVVLVSSSCGDLANINATFDDAANNFVCGGNPAINGTVKPLGSLSSFNGESILGEWTLKITDNAPSDGGSLKAFSMDVCIEGAFRPDADKDGIFDDGDDLCLGTPEGAEVNSTGCPVYRFPNNNFSISAQSETCRNNNDGTINVTAILPLAYEISILGTGVNVSANFTNEFTLPNLSAGTYAICINGTDGAIVYEPNCFEVTIAEPRPLSVSSKISADGKRLTINLAGSDSYRIELNGVSLQTENEVFTVDLKSGSNTLKVSTGLPCQGTYEEQFFHSDQPLVYPNPFTDFLTILLGTETGEVTIGIYGLNGQYIQSTHYSGNLTEIEMELLSLPSGTYILKIDGPTIKATTKIIKK